MMKSIYSLPVLQRILDHFGVGKIMYVTYFQNIGSRVWRHHIETNQGEFELYSYPPDIHEYAVAKIAHAPGAERGYLYPNFCHRFDRYHQLKQFSKKIPITVKQFDIDMLTLKNQKIEKIYRVYGSIIYFDFANGATLSSYGSWKLYLEREREPAELLRDTDGDSHERLDFTLDFLTEKKLTYQSAQLKGDRFQVTLADGYVFHFTAYSEARLEAGRVHLPNRNHTTTIFSEAEVFYLFEL